MFLLIQDKRTPQYKNILFEDADYRPIRRGWLFGDKAMKQELLGHMSERMGPDHYGEERQESHAEKAQRVVGEELRRRQWTEATLTKRNKGDLEKLKMAVRLRQNGVSS